MEPRPSSVHARLYDSQPTTFADDGNVRPIRSLIKATSGDVVRPSVEGLSSGQQLHAETRSMYLRPDHAEHDVPTLRQLIHDTQLGLLITAFTPAEPSSGSSGSRIHTSHVPWVLEVEDPQSTTQLGSLKGHMARQNPQSKLLVELAARTTDGVIRSDEVAVIFTAPDHHYISPSFYTETKPKTGKVVPTWNYASVAAYGNIRVYAEGDPLKSAYLDEQFDTLTRESEALHGPHASDGKRAWEVSDAPAPYINVLKRAVIGVTIEVTRLEGKWKMSQESSEGDRDGVVRGLTNLGTESARNVAETVKSRGCPRT